MLLYSASVNRPASETLLGRFATHRQEFEKAGFHWRGDEAPVSSKSIEVPAWLKEK